MTQPYAQYTASEVYAALHAEAAAQHPSLDAGPYSYAVGLHVMEYASAPSRPVIGKFTSIARNVTFITGGEHLTVAASTAPVGHWVCAEDPERLEHSKGGITVGNDVWIGHGSVILSGVTIGDGAVVGACSVVDADVPPYGVVCGNRAGLRRKRFGDAVVERLLRLRWWDWPEWKLREHHGLLTQPLTEQILSQLEVINDE